MIVAIPNKLVVVSAEVDMSTDQIDTLLTNVTAQVYKEEKLFKNLELSRNNSKWSSSLIFPEEANPGNYTLRWLFNFHGDIIKKEEVITLQSGIKPNITVTVSQEMRIVYPTPTQPKWDQLYVKYIDPAPTQGQDCSRCMHFIREKQVIEGTQIGTCQLVDGNIYSTAICRLFRPLTELGMPDYQTPDVVDVIDEKHIYWNKDSNIVEKQ